MTTRNTMIMKMATIILSKPLTALLTPPATAQIASSKVECTQTVKVSNLKIAPGALATEVPFLASETFAVKIRALECFVRKSNAKTNTSLSVNVAQYAQVGLIRIICMLLSRS